MESRIKWGNLGLFVSLGILKAIFPVAEIALGAFYVNECPAAPTLPVYVMVCGISALLLLALLDLPRLCQSVQGIIWNLCLLSLVLFSVVWFLYGSYVIYSIYTPNFVKNATEPHQVNSSVFAPNAPNLNWTSGLDTQNYGLLSQNQSLLNQEQNPLNQSHTMSNNQTWRKLIQTPLLSPTVSSNVTRDHLKTTSEEYVQPAAVYCNRTLYLLAFWTTTLIYGLGGGALVMTCCFYGCVAMANALSSV